MQTLTYPQTHSRIKKWSYTMGRPASLTTTTTVSTI